MTVTRKGCWRILINGSRGSRVETSAHSKFTKSRLCGAWAHYQLSQQCPLEIIPHVGDSFWLFTMEGIIFYSPRRRTNLATLRLGQHSNAILAVTKTHNSSKKMSGSGFRATHTPIHPNPMMRLSCSCVSVASRRNHFVVIKIDKGHLITGLCNR